MRTVFTNMQKYVYNNIVKRRGSQMKAIDIASWFLWKNNLAKEESEYDDNYDVYEGITHLKLQKLVYYAYGIYYAVNNKPLFKEKIYAWQHGPVIKEMYEELQKYQKNEIPFEEMKSDKLLDIVKDDNLLNILNIVYEYYGGYTAWGLREKTHEIGSPWQITVDTKGLYSKIDKELIRTFFKENILD